VFDLPAGNGFLRAALSDRFPCGFPEGRKKWCKVDGVGGGEGSRSQRPANFEPGERRESLNLGL